MTKTYGEKFCRNGMGNPSFCNTSLLQPQTLESIQMLQGLSVMEVISKAVGLIGYGLTSSSTSWTSNTEFLEIAYQELYPIILSALHWGGKWTNKGLVFQCYNEATVHATSNGTSKRHPICHLLNVMNFDVYAV